MEEVTFAQLLLLARANALHELTAEALPNGSGFYLVANTRAGQVRMRTTRVNRTKKFASLDGVAADVKRLGFDRFTTVGLSDIERSYRGV